MIVGFTGTRKGMSRRQQEQFALVVERFSDPWEEFHHGDARGADSDAVRIVRSIDPDLAIVAHPAGPDPLARNREIVQLSDILIAAPETNKETLRSGTWATVRYARDAGLPIIMLSRGKKDMKGGIQ